VPSGKNEWGKGKKGQTSFPFFFTKKGGERGGGHSTKLTARLGGTPTFFGGEEKTEWYHIEERKKGAALSIDGP